MHSNTLAARASYLSCLAARTAAHPSVHMHSKTLAARASSLSCLAARTAAHPSVQLGGLLCAALVCASVLFLLAPEHFQCPRWAIKVRGDACKVCV